MLGNFNKYQTTRRFRELHIQGCWNFIFWRLDQIWFWTSPIPSEAEHHKNSAVAITDVCKLAQLTSTSTKVDCDVIEEAARAGDHRGGELVAVDDALGLQGEEEERGSKVGKSGVKVDNRPFLFETIFLALSKIKKKIKK